MHDRLKSRGWAALALLVGALMAAPLLAFAGPSGVDSSTSAPADTVRMNSRAQQPPQFFRTTPWWPFASGPYYGDTSAERGDNVVYTPVGSYRIGEKLNLPAELTATLDGLAKGGKQYFLVQLRPSALEQPQWDAALLSLGVTVVGHLPVNAMILAADRAAYDRLQSSPLFQSVEPYHPAYRLSPNIGTMPVSSPEKAATSILDLELRLFAGEPVLPMLEALKVRGVNVVRASEYADGALIHVQADARIVPALAKLEPILQITEVSDHYPLSDGSEYLQYESFSTVQYPYWRSGINGGGQVAAVVDTGLSVNAGDHADTRADGGWTGTGDTRVACTAVRSAASDPIHTGNECATVGDATTHRKVRAYRRAAEYGGIGGDFLGCDAIANGAFSHGQLVTSVILGNATRGNLPAPTNPSPSNGPPYGAGFYKEGLPPDGVYSEASDTAYEGIARHARVVFVDSDTGCPETSLEIPAVQTEVEQTWLNFKATVHNYSLGSAAGASGPVYSGDASGGDTAVRNQPINLVVWAAGNAGANGANGDSDGIGNTSNQATCKNCLVAGGSLGIGGTLYGSTAEGPGPGKRHLITVLAQAFENSCRREGTTAGDENQDRPVSCADIGTAQGTSFAAPNVAGAALIIRDYFAQGFYPDGSNLNSTNNADKVGAVSSRLLRAMLIASGKQVTTGKTVTGDARGNHIWGYGQVFLNRVLPLSGYSSQTANGLIVHDLPGNIDGVAGSDGVSNLTLPATIATGSVSHTAEFQVLDTNQDMTAALVWDDTTTSGVLDNDLDLELRWCGTDGDCATTAGGDVIWLGSSFQEDFNENLTLDAATEKDILNNGVLDGWWYNLSDKDILGAGGTVASYKNRIDNHEGIFIAGRNNAQDLDSDGTPELEALEDVNSAGCSKAAPCKKTGKWQVKVTRVSGTSNGMYFSLAIAGPVAAGSSARFDKNPVTCNGEQVIVVNEVADASDPGCTVASCPESTVKGRVRVEVLDTAGAVVDSIPANTLDFKKEPANGFRFESLVKLPLSLTDSSSANTVLKSGDGYSLRVYYDDVKGAATETKVGLASVDCKPQIEVFTLRQNGVDAQFQLAGGCDDDRYFDQNEEFSIVLQYYNSDLYELVDAEARLTAYDLDPTSGARLGISPYLEIPEPAKNIGTLQPNFLQRTGFGLKVAGTPPARRRTELELCISSAKVGQGTGSCFSFEMLLQADDEKFFYTTDCPTGCTLNFDRNSDERWDDIIKWDPFDFANHVRRNLDESSIAYGNMSATTPANSPGCEGPGDCGNPGFSGPWDFDADNEGFRTGIDSLSNLTTGTTSITNWGEDWNWNGIVDPTLSEDVNNNGKIDSNWGTAGGCGWMTQGAGTTGGVWHTGTIGTWTTAHNTNLCGTGTVRFNESICEQYDTQIGTQGLEYWFEMLRSPKVSPVHFGKAADGYAWKSRWLAWEWNAQVDIADNNSVAYWEVDLDTDDGTFAVLGDGLFLSGTFKPYSNASGLVTGGQLELYGGGFAFAPTCVNSAGCGANGGFGDGTIHGSKGGNRTGKRGCYFNDLNRVTTTSAHRIVRLPAPNDDDCDNEYTLGADGSPGVRGTDDDSNGLVDDTSEICPCFKCNAGPRSGRPCPNSGFCNPTGGTAYFCNNVTNASGVPPAYGDDVCGDGSVDENVAAAFGTSPSIRQMRNSDTNFRNGINNGGRYSGNIGYNNLEDFQVAGKNWQTELGFVTFEPTGSTAAKQGFGEAIDDMVIEWQETHPIAQTSNACTTSFPYYNNNGECARLAVGSVINVANGDKEFPVTVTEPFPNVNVGECTAANGTQGIIVYANSVAELSGETFCLQRIGSTNEFTGNIRSTTRMKVAGDKYVYVAYNGSLPPNITVRYIDKDDGVPSHLWGPGPDGQPGVAGYDDDGNGVNDNVEEQCGLSTTYGPGRSPHLPGTPARYSDDTCGCAQNVPAIENPLVVVIQNAFDTADVVVTDVVVRDDTASGAVGDGDGFADPKEEIILDLNVKNLADYPIQDLELTLSSDSPLVGCIVQDRVTIPLLGKKLTPGAQATAAGFKFRVASATRAQTYDDFSSSWTVTVRGLAKAGLDSFNPDGSPILTDLPLLGTSVVQTFKIVHNLDGTVVREIDFTDNFETYLSDAQALCTPVSPATRCTTAPYVKRNTGDDTAELSGTRCQVNNPGNLYGNNTDPKDYCEIGESAYSNTENHWHLHAPDNAAGPVCEQSVTGDDCPDGGRGHSGSRSLASGQIPGALSKTTPGENGITLSLNRMAWVKTRDTFTLGQGKALNGTALAACTASPGSCADQAPVLEFWTQMRVTDGYFFGDGSNLAWDASITYVCVDENGNNDCDTAEDGAKTNAEQWEPLKAYYSPESSFRLNNFINCMYDPSDDGNDELDFFAGSTAIGPSSTCYPQAVDTCVGRTMAEDTTFGSTYVGPHCWPETGQEGLEGELGSKPAGGKWIRKLYSLKQWRGQKVLFRWHTSPGGFKGAPNCSFFGAGALCGNSDDGWFIDDVRVYGRGGTGSLALDNTDDPGGPSCVGLLKAEGVVARAAAIQYPRTLVSNDPKPASACSVASGSVTVDNCDFNTNGVVDAATSAAPGDAPGRPWILEARESGATACRAGALEYQFESPAGTVLRPWGTTESFVVTPNVTTTYTIRVRCSSEPNTATWSSTTLTIDLGGPPACTAPGNTLLISADKASVTWTGSGTYDTVRGDIAAMVAGNGDFSGATCVEGNGPDTSSSTGTDPAAGAGFYYLVSCDSPKDWNDGTQTGSRTIADCP